MMIIVTRPITINQSKQLDMYQRQETSYAAQRMEHECGERERKKKD